MKVNALPKTGDSNNLISVISGFFLLIVSLIVEKIEKQSGNTLPKTGEDKGLISVFTGFFLLFLSFVAFSLRRDRQA